MSIQGLSGVSLSQAMQSAAGIQKPEPIKAGGPETVSFGDRMEGALENVARAQDKAATSAAAFEMGTEQDLASVMVNQQIASLGFQLTLNVRNKALGAYRDIMNMPV